MLKTAHWKQLHENEKRRKEKKQEGEGELGGIIKEKNMVK